MLYVELKQGLATEARIEFLAGSLLYWTLIDESPVTVICILLSIFIMA